MRLNQDEKDALLTLARKTLTHYFEHGEVPAPAEVGITVTPRMQSVRAAFVTLERDGNLRGCIGDIYPTQPLYRSVMQNVLAAALRDRRFKAVTAEEFKLLHLEISALTPPREVASYGDIVIGKHGVILSKGGRRAVFLPQVAPDQGWDVAQTLTHLARKAGLPADAWKSGARFLVFEANVFGEHDG